MKILAVLLCFVVMLACGDEGANIPTTFPDAANNFVKVNLADSNATPLASHILQSTVHISVSNSEYPGEGSGFVCAENLIATAYHVIKAAYKSEDPTYIKVHSVLGGKVYSATAIAASNEGNDIAIVRVPDYPAPALSFADSDMVYIPQEIVIVGSPLGYVGTVHLGHISAIRNQKFSSFQGKAIQIMAATAPGLSGGPVANLQGRVIGIHVASIPNAANMALVIPSNTLKNLLDSIPAPTSPIQR